MSGGLTPPPPLDNSWRATNGEWGRMCYLLSRDTRFSGASREGQGRTCEIFVGQREKEVGEYTYIHTCLDDAERVQGRAK